MQFRKIAAVAGSALMGVTMAAGAALAATSVGDILTLAKPSDSTANFPIFVIGKTAKPEDVTGAVDIAVRLAAESKTSVAVTTTGAAVTGIERDGIAIGASSTSKLSTAVSGGTAFPTGNLTSIHYTGLKDSVVTWSGDSADYDYKEQVDLSGVLVRHALTENNINGTEKFVVGTSGAIKYAYVFDKEFNFTPKGSTGTIASPQYTYPLNIKLLGKDFTVVGAGATSIKMLSGTIGTAKKQGSDVTGVTSGDYSIYVTGGANNDWASFEIKDKTGNKVAGLSGITEGSSKPDSVSGLTIKVTDVRVSGTDPATMIIEADVVVGPTGQVEKEYDSTADVEATGTTNDAFPGASRWGIRYTPAGGATDRKISKGSMIEVVYLPKETEYYVAGQKISLPNNYGDLGFEGFNTDKFATVSVKPYGAASGYTVTNKTSVGVQEAYGFEISSSDVAGTIGSNAGNAYDKAYLLFGKVSSGNYPVYVGFYDKSTGKILINDNEGTDAQTAEYAVRLNATAGPTNFTYAFPLSYGGAGEVTKYLNITVGARNTTTVDLYMNLTTTSADATNGRIAIYYQQKTSPAWSTTAAPQFQLGSNDGSGDDDEIKIITEGSGLTNAGKKTQEIVVDGGFLLQPTSSSTGSNAVVFKVPSKELAVKAYFGKAGAAAATTGGTADQVIPVTTDVVKLDTEIVSTDGTTVQDAYKTQNLVVIGSPAVNLLAYQLLVPADKKAANPFPVYGYKWTDVGVPIEKDKAIVKVVQDAYSTGKVAVLVAGWEAQNTKAAALAIQASKLAGNTKDTATIAGTDVNSLTIS